MAGASPLDVALVLKVLAASKHSAPGPDGLPFSAWQGAGLAGATTLANVGALLRAGYP